MKYVAPDSRPSWSSRLDASGSMPHQIVPSAGVMSCAGTGRSNGSLIGVAVDEASVRVHHVTSSRWRLDDGSRQLRSQAAKSPYWTGSSGSAADRPAKWAV